MFVAQKELINWNIKGDRIHLIVDEDNKGIVLKSDAIKLANDRNLDLVQVSFNTYPICKILDFGKYKYELSKKQKQNKPIVTKEVRMRVGTEEHDFQIKFNHISEFISKGHSVKVTIQMRGREQSIGSRQLAVARLENVCYKLAEVTEKGRVEQSKGAISVLLTPKKA